MFVTTTCVCVFDVMTVLVPCPPVGRLLPGEPGHCEEGGRRLEAPGPRSHIQVRGLLPETCWRRLKSTGRHSSCPQNKTRSNITFQQSRELQLTSSSVCVRDEHIRDMKIKTSCVCEHANMWLAAGLTVFNTMELSSAPCSHPYSIHSPDPEELLL